uniref:Uncharacterized protein n=1 Tax=Arundo donax TaxID=35708 RepID=A0A0A9A9W9_ARUDO
MFRIFINIKSTVNNLLVKNILLRFTTSPLIVASCLPLMNL